MIQILTALLFLILTMGNGFAASTSIVTIEQHPQVLKSIAKPISFPLNNEDKSLINSMKAKLYELQGVGLAAPQVNQSKQVIAVFIPENAALLRENVHPYPMHILINPRYEPAGKEKTSDFEGCYSVSNKMGKVPRYQTIKLDYQDESGKRHQSIETGFYARVLQHEIDHLSGVLITDRLTPDCVQGSIKEMTALRRNELSEDKKVLFDKLMQLKMKK